MEGLTESGTATVELADAGTLVTTSGVVTVLDLGYDNDDARRLARTVPPGSYPVDRVIAAGRNAAVRVRFSETPPVQWRPADIPAGGHVFGVDAGSACIVDYVAYAAMTRREKADAFRRFIAAPRPSAITVPLRGADVGIAVESGRGDGSYPAYWGLDANGQDAQLVVDFMVMVTQDEDDASAGRSSSAPRRDRCHAIRAKRRPALDPDGRNRS